MRPDRRSVHAGPHVHSPDNSGLLPLSFTSRKSGLHVSREFVDHYAVQPLWYYHGNVTSVTGNVLLHVGVSCLRLHDCHATRRAVLLFYDVPSLNVYTSWERGNGLVVTIRPFTMY